MTLTPLTPTNKTNVCAEILLIFLAVCKHDVDNIFKFAAE